MKQIGFILLVVGILITAYTGFNYVTKEKVVDIGPLEITQDKNHSVAWSPIIGIAVIVLGGGLVLFGNKKA